MGKTKERDRETEVVTLSHAVPSPAKSENAAVVKEMSTLCMSLYKLGVKDCTS